MKIRRELPLNERVFEIIDGVLYAFEHCLREAGLSVNYYRKEKSARNERLEFLDHPKDKRFNLVAFESISANHKAAIVKRWKDPYDYVSKNPIRQMVELDAKAETFYSKHRYDGNKELPIEYRNKYTIAASWLNMIDKVCEDTSIIKKELGISTVTKFWELVCEIIKSDNIALPSSFRRLIYNSDSALKRYKKDGYITLVSERFGNKCAAKIGKSEYGFDPELEKKQVAVIKKFARLHMNLDAKQIESNANKIFELNGWEKVSSATILNLISKHMPTLMPGRKGAKHYNNKVAMQVVREAPEFPTYYWTLDGWTVELMYRDEQGKYTRMVMVVVLDAAHKYPVGFAIGERENTELIRMALRNAVIHMQDLFGATYRPWQLQSDRYGIKNLTPFYNAVSHLHTPAAVGNAKSKIVEPYFKYLNKICQQEFNWSGFNITADQDNQPNIEMIDKIKHTFPDKDGVIKQITKMMWKERAGKIQDYKAAWERMPFDDKVTLSPEDCLHVFGQPHDEYNSIEGIGLKATLNGQKMIFDSFDPAFRALQFTTDFKLIYDSEDFSQVLALTRDGKQRFLLHNKVRVGMGFKNTTPEQLEYKQQIKSFNIDRKEEILQEYISEDAIVQDVINNTPLNLSNEDELKLKAMLTYKGQQKETLQDAKGLKRIKTATEKAVQKEKTIEAEQHESSYQKHLEQHNDFSQFL